jgi:nucleoside-diphosphate-sugar epimerase
VKKYLIVGGHGFIGSTFCKTLDPNEYDVYDILQFSGNPSERTLMNRLDGVNNNSDFSEIILEKYEYVIHFGAFAGVRTTKTWEEYFENNCMDLLTLLTIVNFDKLVYISSSSVLGDVASYYSLSKMLAESIAKKHQATIIRPFTVYGSWGRDEMFITKCLKGKHILVNGPKEDITRRFTYVEDLIVAIKKYAGQEGTWNVMGPKAYSLGDILALTGNEYTQGEVDERDVTKNEINGHYHVCPTYFEDVFDSLEVDRY